MENTFEFLRLIQSRDLSFWDIKAHSCKSVCSQFVVIKLKDYLIEQNKKEKLFKYPDKYFKILGVNNQNGLFDAYEEQGKNINQPYKKVENGWFAYNPYRVNVGSIGLKSVQQNNEYISPAYVVFSCKEALLPDYLNIIIRTKFFNEAIKANTTGSVRQTLGFNNLCNIEIPLPSLKRQKELVAEYDALLNLVKNKENQAKQIEQSIDDYLLQNLNLTQVVLNNESESTLLKFINFSQTKYWHYNYFFSPYKNIYDIENIGINFVPLSSLVLSISSGKDERDYKNEGYEYLRVSNIRPGKLLLNDVKYISALPKCQHGVVKNGDFIITRKGSYGYAVYLDFIKQNYAISSEIFKVILKDNEKLNKKYLEYIFNSPVIQTQIENIKTRGIMGSINIPALKSIEIPLLPLDIQARIVEEITLRKEQIKNLRDESEKLRSQALSDFEKEVFN